MQNSPKYKPLLHYRMKWGTILLSHLFWQNFLNKTPSRFVFTQHNSNVTHMIIYFGRLEVIKCNLNTSKVTLISTDRQLRELWGREVSYPTMVNSAHDVSIPHSSVKSGLRSAFTSRTNSRLHNDRGNNRTLVNGNSRPKVGLTLLYSTNKYKLMTK